MGCDALDDPESGAEIDLRKGMLGQNDVGPELAKGRCEILIRFNPVRGYLHSGVAELIQHQLGVGGALVHHQNANVTVARCRQDVWFELVGRPSGGKLIWDTTPRS